MSRTRYSAQLKVALLSPLQSLQYISEVDFVHTCIGKYLGEHLPDSYQKGNGERVSEE